jgi:magnesium transporter
VEDFKAITERLATLIELDAWGEINDFINELNISDVVEVMEEFEEHASRFFLRLDFNRAVAVFGALDTNDQEDLLHAIPANKVAQLLNELPPDDRTALLSEQDSSVVKELIKVLKPEERKITLSLLGYPEDSVGRLMTPDYIDVEPDWTVEQVLNFIRDYGKSSETIDVVYVTDENGTFLDDIRIRDFLIVEPSKTLVSDLMDERFITLNVNEDQETTMDVFQKNNRVALPVVDDKNILLGIVTIDDVLVVQEEEFTEDIQKIGGTEALDEAYLDTSIPKLYKKRVIWLMVLFVGELLTILAMRNFEDSIAKVALLATFIPLIISSGGNTGSQAATLIIQAMALDDIDLRDWWRIMRKEIISGVLLGVTLCIMSFLIFGSWHLATNSFGENYIPISLVIGCSLIGVVLWGTLTGSMLPILLKRLGADPAASSTPFVATLVDVSGLIIYFSFAMLFLSGGLL